MFPLLPIALNGLVLDVPGQVYEVIIMKRFVFWFFEQKLSEWYQLLLSLNDKITYLQLIFHTLSCVSFVCLEMWLLYEVLIGED